MANKWYILKEGNMTMRNLLGGNIEMTEIGLLPQGFTMFKKCKINDDYGSYGRKDNNGKNLP